MQVLLVLQYTFLTAARCLCIDSDESPLLDATGRLMTHNTAFCGRGGGVVAAATDGSCGWAPGGDAAGTRRLFNLMGLHVTYVRVIPYLFVYLAVLVHNYSLEGCDSSSSSCSAGMRGADSQSSINSAQAAPRRTSQLSQWRPSSSGGGGGTGGTGGSSSGIVIAGSRAVETTADDGSAAAVAALLDSLDGWMHRAVLWARLLLYDIAHHLRCCCCCLEALVLLLLLLFLLLHVLLLRMVLQRLLLCYLMHCIHYLICYSCITLVSLMCYHNAQASASRF